MTDAQLYSAIGVPAAFFVVNLLAILLCQARGWERTFNSRMDALQSVMLAKFEAINTKFAAVDARFEAAHQGLLRVEGVLDARLRHLENR